MKNFHIYIIIFLTVLYSCTKVKEEKSPDGKLIKRYEYYEDENGSVIKNGTYQSWYGNEIVEFIGEYKDNKKQGHWKQWNKENIQIIDCNYNNGELEGEHKLFDDNGNLKELSFYKNNLLNGTKTIYDEEGNIEQETEYLSDLKNGTSIRYYNGEKTYKEKFEKGIPVDKWISYNEDGSVFYELNYIDGCPKEFKGKWKVDGDRKTYMEFMDNGNLKYSHPKYKYKHYLDPIVIKELKFEIVGGSLVLKEKNGNLYTFYFIQEINNNTIKLNLFEDDLLLKKV